MNYGNISTLNTLDVYDVSNNSWTSKTGPNQAASELAVAENNGKIYILGSRSSISRGQDF